MIDNPIVQQEQLKLQEIAPELTVSRVTKNDDKITSIGVIFPLKGNKELINKLRRNDWKWIKQASLLNKTIVSASKDGVV